MARRSAYARPAPEAGSKAGTAQQSNWRSKGAAWLQERVQRLSRRVKITGLLLFCLLAGGYSLYLVLGGRPGGQRDILSPLQQPLYQLPPHVPDAKRAPLITEMEYARVRQFRRHLDSLSRSAAGRAILERLQASCPALMDSILLLEHLYRLQSKPIPTWKD